LASSNLETSRSIHNNSAVAPDTAVAKKSLGDLSHMIYGPLDPSGSEPSAFLILGIWNNIDGLNQLFANKAVQEQAGQIFQ